MIAMFGVLVSIIFLVLVCSGYCANFPYFEGKRGWWWYEDPKKEEKIEKVYNDTTIIKVQPPLEVREPKKEEPKEPPKKEELRIKPLHEYSYEELLYMPVEEFRKIFEYYANKAISEPTEENVYNYFNLVDVLRKKAFLFSSVYAYVAQKYGQYLPGVVYPVNVPGIESRLALQTNEVERIVFGRINDYGLVFFVRSGCPYCEVQYNILKRLIARGVRVKVVDITGRSDLVSRFGIEVVPTIVLVYKNGDYIPISSGVESLDSLMFKIYRGIAILEGENPGRYGLYDFQKGTPLDPFEPPPLWRNKNSK
ncbi:MAG: conjugal transfer protein TraF [Candidatus Aenigmatarchaeota archaeon]